MTVTAPRHPPIRVRRNFAAGRPVRLEWMLALVTAAFSATPARAGDPPPPAGPAVPAAPLAPVAPMTPAPPAIPSVPVAPSTPATSASGLAPAASSAAVGTTGTSSADAFERSLSPSQRAEKALLEHLGWRFVTDPHASSVVVVGGAPTQRANLASAQAAGDLRVVLPASPSPSDLTRLAQSLGDVADSIPSRGAWQFLVAPAVERATQKLSANAESGRWVFPQWLFVSAQIFSMAPPKAAWVKRSSVWAHARSAPSAAIEAFYADEASTECFVAQTLAAYAIQYEVLGARRFDSIYAPEEIAIGQVEAFHKTPLGKDMNTPPGYPWRALFLRPGDADEDAGLVLARLGPLAFPGMTGILMDQEGSARSNENFTFVSVGQPAVESLIRHGGFKFIGEQSRELLPLRDASRSRFVTGAQLEAWKRRYDAILADPVFTDIRIYIHPYGVVTLGSIVHKTCGRDRNAVELILYNEAREDVFFQRYKSAWKADWVARRTTTPTGR